jgi:hypothetical protein
VFLRILKLFITMVFIQEFVYPSYIVTIYSIYITVLAISFIISCNSVFTMQNDNKLIIKIINKYLGETNSLEY